MILRSSNQCQSNAITLKHPIDIIFFIIALVNKYTIYISNRSPLCILDSTYF